MDEKSVEQSQQTGQSPPQVPQVLSKRQARKARAKELQKQRQGKKQAQTKPNRGYGQNVLQETRYYFENGLRKVQPYYFTFSCYAKERWYGRKILDVYAEEFLHLTRDEYKEFIAAGQLKVNGQQISPDYVLQNGDHISHTVHRHENPVADLPIEIIDINDDIVVVNKPSSIPVHPCGNYRHNSVVFILGKELNLFNLRTIYRLDRLTSGVLVLGRSYQRTHQLERQVLQRKVLKEYVCRVVGEFPSERVDCEEPMDILSPKMGVWRVCAKGEGKECFTIFERMSYNGKTSVVKCKPITGRTHQIRVHLQYLGYPIINDPIYNGKGWGPVQGKGGEYGKTLKQLEEDLSTIHAKENFLVDYSDLASGGTDDPNSKDEAAADNGDYSQEVLTSQVSQEAEVKNISQKRPSDFDDQDCDQAVKRLKSESESASNSTSDEDKSVKIQCKDCKVRYKDPAPEDLVMYLHAYKYQGPDWEYGTDTPEWAKASWVDPKGIAS